MIDPKPPFGRMVKAGPCHEGARMPVSSEYPVLPKAQRWLKARKNLCQWPLPVKLGHRREKDHCPQIGQLPFGQVKPPLRERNG